MNLIIKFNSITWVLKISLIKLFLLTGIAILFGSCKYNNTNKNAIGNKDSTSLTNENSIEDIDRNIYQTLKIGDQMCRSKLNEMLSNDKLKKFWNIKKQDTRICKVCEYRHFCIDSRVPYFDEVNNEYYHIDDCDYNPYTNKWNYEQN